MQFKGRCTEILKADSALSGGPYAMSAREKWNLVNDWRSEEAVTLPINMQCVAGHWNVFPPNLRPCSQSSVTSSGDADESTQRSKSVNFLDRKESLARVRKRQCFRIRCLYIFCLYFDWCNAY